jgi:hypothetical protein
MLLTRTYNVNFILGYVKLYLHLQGQKCKYNVQYGDKYIQ